MSSTSTEVGNLMHACHFDAHPSLSLLGHSMVPAIIPTGTILYHGRTDDHVPDVPEWLGFDVEHAYILCMGPCYVISLQTKRDLRLLYFDGTAAAKMQDGPLDSQDIVAWGKLRPDKYSAEWERIGALCDRGKPFGLDGFIRMEYHLCVIHLFPNALWFRGSSYSPITAKLCYAISQMGSRSSRSSTSCHIT
jgi:hypothetical protein